jgi:2-iminobutanoate/2-iminopropanoate deaminase
MPLMERKVVSTEAAPRAIGPYSQAISWGSLVFCSGQVALDPQTGALVGAGDVQSETRRALDNLAAVLVASGSRLDRVLKTTVFLVDMADFAAMNEVYAQYFQSNPPARATVAVAGLPKGARVEIEAIAWVGA